MKKKGTGIWVPWSDCLSPFSVQMMAKDCKPEKRSGFYKGCHPRGSGDPYAALGSPDLSGGDGARRASRAGNEKIPSEARCWKVPRACPGGNHYLWIPAFAGMTLI
ncbi:MAG: hypothetical protein A3G33_07280 [Omnitrophica bacterium RIFCSPLOWO2_12_FULL_44_17]|uniref:Uncharacterized protein n=1 Tax=Candidatus Danuiimicrobium aquiferis TaxID=1801832 RepID=A0A1G1KYQ0_9BACT|nr:MAG: hypothetical protein A3B72_07580 [Omnitrophica bacterium RIFCSPHIGHO2_02_FULL_45_28]OGW89229.1 MAG: hypothetical protein A3E74_08255 [Omnitrophica bacterium RIFCSPHIGHO2_12_FULL_44_12]OGW98028.1 MAG: hypothetical protein A3G33_07280 [Omnitrophica bacterium RIFCSPLOWO2_12_FULL_44_17]OGX03527.1 MAG: hypothetical protein A3J12_02950 [Omnitrophica bacterium RIFCSPLOWO2_02_FULL_44_11]